MSRSPRVIAGNKSYEIVARAKEGLPLPPTGTTNAILMGTMARVQMDDKVVLNNFVWMSNHVHIQAMPIAPGNFPKFYGDIQKKTTEAIKALRGLENLNIWEGRATTMELHHLGDAINRLVYIFCNPTAAGLVDKIDDFPGVNSWQAFVSCEASIDAAVEIQAKWYPSSTIPRLPSSGRLSHQEDRQMLEALKSETKAPTHTLVINPLAWLKYYGVTDPVEVEQYRQEIIRRVRANEAAYREERIKNNRRIIGPEALSRESYLQQHRPKKKERKIFLICNDTEGRIRILAWYREIFKKCRDCYRALKQGLPVSWPAGTFPPWSAPSEHGSSWQINNPKKN